LMGQGDHDGKLFAAEAIFNALDRLHRLRSHSRESFCLPRSRRRCGARPARGGSGSREWSSETRPGAGSRDAGPESRVDSRAENATAGCATGPPGADRLVGGLPARVRFVPDLGPADHSANLVIRAPARDVEPLLLSFGRGLGDNRGQRCPWHVAFCRGFAKQRQVFELPSDATGLPRLSQLETHHRDKVETAGVAQFANRVGLVYGDDAPPQ
jgi:hypothetical protein